MVTTQFFKKALLCLGMLFFGIITTGEINLLSDKDHQSLSEIGKNGSLCNKLCISKVLAKCIKTKQLKADQLESGYHKTHTLCSESINTESLCANTINARDQICAPSFNSPSMCTEQLTATNICSNGLVRVNALQQCGLYRATIVFSGSSPYTLGNPINFDFALDDPNGNVSFGPTTYTAPLSGYYAITAQFNQQDLIGADTIAGIPIGNLEILVNGFIWRENFVPYLSFHNEQKTTITSLISLTAGDQVTLEYNVFVMTDALGFTPYAGTVNVLGNGTEANSSMLKIHYLSSDCTGLPCIPCQPCTSMPCGLPCESIADCCDMDCCEMM